MHSRGGALRLLGPLEAFRRSGLRRQPCEPNRVAAAPLGLKVFGFVNSGTLYAITAEHNRKHSKTTGDIMNTINECAIAGIPCLRINPYIQSKDTILLYHGWASNIGDYIFFGSLISNWGYTVIIPELPYHGARDKSDYFDLSVLQQHYWNIVIQAVEEASGLINELHARDKIVGVMGNSAGGFVAAGIFSKTLSIKFAIVMNGSCAWARFEEQICERDRREPWMWIDKGLIEKLDPITSIETIKNRSMLMLHGTEDTTIPIDSQRYFMARFSWRGWANTI